ncbi:MAG: RNA-binding protein [Candidatus Thorarchaeota archaeon]|nr:RNA-binding protein [Candidatus Thorarchaeota archaeon]MCK5240164.1 RNA-binding protein [Candidatus Thorarchaeota archaeon]
MALFFTKREIVVPGQLLAEGRYRADVGAYGKDEKVYSAVVGLAELRGNTVKVVPLQGVYIPSEGDLIIGKITIVAGNNWKVDLGSGPYLASLHANNALRRPYDDDISRYMGIGDVIVAEVSAFDRNSGPFLFMKGRGLQKLEGGMLMSINPAKVPRVIGRRGSMISMIKDLLRVQTVVGQNGIIWIRSRDPKIMRLAVKAFEMIEAEAHTSKLTDRVHDMLKEELKNLKGSIDEDDYPSDEDEGPPKDEAFEEAPVETEPEPEVESEPAPEPEPEVVPEDEPTETKEEPSEVEAKPDKAKAKPKKVEEKPEEKEVSEE